MNQKPKSINELMAGDARKGRAVVALKNRLVEQHCPMTEKETVALWQLANALFELRGVTNRERRRELVGQMREARGRFERLRRDRETAAAKKVYEESKTKAKAARV